MAVGNCSRKTLKNFQKDCEKIVEASVAQAADDFVFFLTDEWVEVEAQRVLLEYLQDSLGWDGGAEGPGGASKDFSTVNMEIGVRSDSPPGNGEGESGRRHTHTRDTRSLHPYRDSIYFLLRDLRKCIEKSDLDGEEYKKLRKFVDCRLYPIPSSNTVGDQVHDTGSDGRIHVVRYRNKDGSMSYGYRGLCACHNGACPVCGVFLRYRWSVTLREACRRYVENGYSYAMMTLTIPHIATIDGLDDLYKKVSKALKYFRSGRSGTFQRENMKQIGYSRVMGLMLDHPGVLLNKRTGPQLHYHIIVFMDREPIRHGSEEYRILSQTLSRYWTQCLKRAGILTNERDEGNSLAFGFRLSVPKVIAGEKSADGSVRSAERIVKYLMNDIEPVSQEKSQDNETSICSIDEDIINEGGLGFVGKEGRREGRVSFFEYMRLVLTRKKYSDQQKDLLKILCALDGKAWRYCSPGLLQFAGLRGEQDEELLENSCEDSEKIYSFNSDVKYESWSRLSRWGRQGSFLSGVERWDGDKAAIEKLRKGIDLCFDPDNGGYIREAEQELAERYPEKDLSIIPRAVKQAAQGVSGTFLEYSKAKKAWVNRDERYDYDPDIINEFLGESEDLRLWLLLHKEERIRPWNLFDSPLTVSVWDAPPGFFSENDFWVLSMATMADPPDYRDLPAWAVREWLHTNWDFDRTACKYIGDLGDLPKPQTPLAEFCEPYMKVFLAGRKKAIEAAVAENDLEDAYA